jgi:phosphate transport system substrate-binding protein
MLGERSQLWNRKFRIASFIPLVLVGLVLDTSAEVQLTGAGATFPSALYTRWFRQYATVDGGVQIQYQAIGSGGGMKRLMDQSTAFGASDTPMTDEQMQAAKGGAILHVPAAMGAVVVIYNLPNGVSRLKLTPKTLEEVFSGKITQWNDPQLTRLNPGLPLPGQTITVVHRSDGSGTTQIITDYLSKVSEEWKKRVGQGTAVIWPVGIAAKRNEGVAELVKRTPGAISYVELSQALQSGTPQALVQNRAGNFIEPTLASVSAAATKTMPATAGDLRVSLTDAPGPDAYPIATFTWFLVYKNQSNKDQGEKLVDFLWWMMHEGQKEAPALHYAPLPKEVVIRGEQTLTEITYEGQPLLTKK